MSTPTIEIARFSNNIKNILSDLVDRISNQLDDGNYRAQDVFKAFVVGTGGAHGVGSSGDLAAADIGQTTNVYLQFKLPILSTDEGVSFKLQMEGYGYGSSKIIDVNWAGRISSGALAKVVSGTHPADAYIDTNGNVVVSVLFSSVYYTTFQITAFSHDNSKRIVRGQLQGKPTLSAQTVF